MKNSYSILRRSPYSFNRQAIQSNTVEWSLHFLIHLKTRLLNFRKLFASYEIINGPAVGPHRPKVLGIQSEPLRTSRTPFAGQPSLCQPSCVLRIGATIRCGWPHLDILVMIGPLSEADLLRFKMVRVECLYGEFVLPSMAGSVSTLSILFIHSISHFLFYFKSLGRI